MTAQIIGPSKTNRGNTQKARAHGRRMMAKGKTSSKKSISRDLTCAETEPRHPRRRSVASGARTTPHGPDGLDGPEGGAPAVARRPHRSAVKSRREPSCHRPGTKRKESDGGEVLKPPSKEGIARRNCIGHRLRFFTCVAAGALSGYTCFLVGYIAGHSMK